MTVCLLVVLDHTQFHALDWNDMALVWVDQIHQHRLQLRYSFCCNLCWGEILCSSPSLCRGPNFLGRRTSMPLSPEKQSSSLLRGSAWQSWRAWSGTLLLGVWQRVFEISATVGRSSSVSWSAIGKCRNECCPNTSGLAYKVLPPPCLCSGSTWGAVSFARMQTVVFVTSLVDEASTMIHLTKELDLQLGNEWCSGH